MTLLKETTYFSPLKQPGSHVFYFPYPACSFYIYAAGSPRFTQLKGYVTLSLSNMFGNSTPDFSILVENDILVFVSINYVQLFILYRVDQSKTTVNK